MTINTNASIKACSRLAATIGCRIAAVGTAVASDRPNILLIITDDGGYSEIRCYGGEIDTPKLDQYPVFWVFDLNNQAFASFRELCHGVIRLLWLDREIFPDSSQISDFGILTRQFEIQSCNF